MRLGRLRTGLLTAALALAGAAAVAALAPGAARAQSGLAQEIEQLYREAARLRQDLNSGAATGLSTGQAQDVQSRLGALEVTAQQLTGRVEEAQFRLRQIEQRLQALEAGAGAATVGVAPSTSGGSAPSGGGTLGQLSTTGLPTVSGSVGAAVAAAPTGGPSEQYAAAMTQLRQGDYAGAETAFRRFAERYSKDPLAANALYWLAETHYARADYAGAAAAFADAYKRYPNGSKAPDVVLKLGMTLGQLGKSSEACTALGLIRQKFPQASANLVRRADIERGKLGCG